MRSILRRALVATAGLLVLACANPKVGGPGANGGGSGGPSGGGSGSGGSRAGGSGSGGFTLADANPTKPPGGSYDAGPVAYPGGVTRPCVDLECRQTTCVMGDCKQPTCAGAARSTLSGRIYDPAGKVPLYNVVIYVPNAPLDPIATGPGCDRCDTAASGKPITATLTDTKGDFVLGNVPVGANVPLVIQVGKWRRQIVLPEMKACVDNPVADRELMRLPRNQREGNIPKIALTTGGYDRLECLLRKIGVEESEFTQPTGEGRVNYYAGKGGLTALPTTSYAPNLNGGATFPSAIEFWNDPNNLKKYDMVLLSCEGNWNPDDKSMVARQGLVDYANAGGRVFASHWHGVWIQFGPPPWNTIANFVPASPLGGMAQFDPPFNFNPYQIDTTFPKGEALADWLVNVQASTTRGTIALTEAKHSVISVDANMGRRWIYSDTIPLTGGNPAMTGVQYLTFNTPVGAAADKYCGRTVFTDIHVSAGDVAGVPWPTGCRTMDLSPQEKALEFMLFDLSSCIQPDYERPKPPFIP